MCKTTRKILRTSLKTDFPKMNTQNNPTKPKLLSLTPWEFSKSKDNSTNSKAKQKSPLTEVFSTKNNEVSVSKVRESKKSSKFFSSTTKQSSLRRNLVLWMCPDSIVTVRTIIGGGPDPSWKKGPEYWKGKPMRRFLDQTLVQYRGHCRWLQTFNFNWIIAKIRGENKRLKRERRKNKTCQTW